MGVVAVLDSDFDLASMPEGVDAEKHLGLTHQQKKNNLSILDRVDLTMANRLVGDGIDHDLIAGAQRALDSVRRPTPTDADFLSSLLRLRGFRVDEETAADVLEGRESALSSLSQEYRLLRGLQKCLVMMRARASNSLPPDGWFLLELFRTMTHELPRFRNNELRRGPPWDAMLYVNYPVPEQLCLLVDSFERKRCYRDAPIAFNGLHPVRQGFRILWRFARIAPLPDFNIVVAWLGMNAWLQSKGYPLLCATASDQQFVTKLLSGPPPSKVVQLEARLLEALEPSK